MYGIALEGGGVRGAYHIGAVKAILENGFDIGAIVGTSIGAFNAAVIAQNDFKMLYDIWYNSDSRIAIDFDKSELSKVSKGKLDVKSIKYIYNYVTKNVAGKGIETEKLRKVYTSCIDEEKLRNSNIIYGLTVVSLTDKKPLYLYKEDIPQGKIIDYVLASSNLPVFKQDSIIDGKKYIDGGFYDNCPIKLLIDKGITDIFEIRTEAIGVYRKINTKGLNVYSISPSKDLKGILFADNDRVRENILMGYYDAVRVIKGYLGCKYYIIPTSDDKVFNAICNVSDEDVSDLIQYVTNNKNIKNMESRKILFEKILPYIASKLGKNNVESYQRLIVALLEEVASYIGLSEYKLYEFDEFMKLCINKSKKLLKEEEKLLIKNNSKILFLKFALSIGKNNI